jgi:hypothetical protein
VDPQVARCIELLRGVYEPALVRTGHAASVAEVDRLERELGLTLPSEHKDIVEALGFVCVGDPATLVIYGIAPADHGCPHEVDVGRSRQLLGNALVPVVRIVTSDGETTYAVGEDSRLHVVIGAGPARPVDGDFLGCLHRALQGALESRLEAMMKDAGVPPELADFDVPGAGQATLQMHAVPRVVVAALKKEPAVADEITLYTSVAEFREQTVAWEKYLSESDPPERKELVRRMRSLLKQPGVAKLTELVGPSVDLVRWPDAIVACFGEEATESLALRGTVELPSEGTDTIHLLPIAEVKQVAAVLADSEARLRANYRADVLRARRLYNTDAPNEAAFLEELCAMWDAVVEEIQRAAADGCGWLIRRTEG